VFRILTDSVRSASRVLDLLEHLAAQSEGVSLTQAAASLNLPKSSTLMLLRTLLARGYVTREAGDLYRLNETFRRVGFGWGGHRLARLIALAEPVMQELCGTVGETVILGALEGTHVRLLAKAVAPQAIRYDADLSTPSPAYCTAIGRVLLAFASPDRCEEVLLASKREKLTAATVTALPALQAIIRGASIERLAIVEEEFALGGTGIAAPVFGPDGAALAALDVACVTTRFHLKRAAVIAALQGAAGRLSALLAGGEGGDKHERRGGRDERQYSEG
jgi:DNA-binding IclR family transcriptional regulator